MSGAIVHGGGITAAARLYGGRFEDWLDLSTGINPNPVAVPALPQAVWHRLPDQRLVEEARVAASRYYRSGACLPLPVPGTQSVIQLLPRLIDGGRRVAILSPTYGEYRRVFELAGLGVDMVTNPGAIGEVHGIVVIVNPNNPDGRIVGARELVDLQQRLTRQGGILVVDEAFGDASAAESVAPLAAEVDNLIVFRSFGKFFGLAGLRLGFVVAAPALLQRFETWLGPWSVSGPALALAASCLSGDTGAIGRGIAERSACLHRVLADARLAVVGGTDLFALVAERRAPAIYEHLCRHRILVRKFDYATEWLRFGLAPDEDADRRLAHALRSLEN